jgi:hypothetical protein
VAYKRFELIDEEAYLRARSQNLVMKLSSQEEREEESSFLCSNGRRSYQRWI